MCRAALWGPFHFNQMGGKLVFTAVSRWNYKSRQPLPPCRGPTTAATLCVSLKIFSGPSSSNLGFFFIYIHHTSPLRTVVSIKRRAPINLLPRSIGTLICAHSQCPALEVNPTTGPSFWLFSPQQPMWLWQQQARPPPLNLHYDGFQGIRALSVLNERWQETQHGYCFSLRP